MESARPTKYNTVTTDCASRCQRIRAVIEAGVSPGTAISQACEAAGVTYGRCHSETGPTEQENGRQRCHLPPEAGMAVDAYAAGARTAAARQAATQVLTELRMTAVGAV